ncbi:MAG: hypothetical protein KC636_12345 [Myxococcales bacterium]|nr:hypothetical protein [Myxococcales bacterium]
MTRTVDKRLSLVGKALLLGAALGLHGGLTQGCVLINQNHCALNDGVCDAGMVCSKCASDNNGCVAEVEPSCAFAETTGTDTAGPTSSDPTTEDSETTDPTTLDPTDITDTTTATTTPITDTDTSETDTTTEPTTGPVTCDPAEPEVGCGGSTPYCVAIDTCGTCEDLIDSGETCSGAIGVGTPACDVASGYCVECTAEDLTACADPNQSVCNPYTLQCDKCREHSQCPVGACNLISGDCFPEDDGSVIWVHNRSTDCNATDGSEDSPYCLMSQALADADFMKPVTIKVIDGGDQYPQNETHVLEGTYIIAVVGVGDEPPLFRTTTSGMILNPRAGATVFLERLWFDGSAMADPVLQAEGQNTQLWIDHTAITNNQRSINVNINAEVYLRSSTVYKNKNGIQVTGELAVVNSYIVENGVPNLNEGQPPGVNKDPAFTLVGGGKAEVVYSTLVGNAGFKASIADCTAADNPESSEIRNSVIIGKTPLYPENMGDCGPGLDGGGNYEASFNADLAGFDTSELFDGPSSAGVYKALAGGDLEDVASWSGSDPYGDFDGTPRPAMNGAKDYAGADRP